MNFKLVFSQTAKETLKDLKHSKNKEKIYKALTKTLKFLGENPRHPSLRTHKYYSLAGPEGEAVFEAYVQQNTPSAYRVFFFYGPDKKSITVIAVIPHP